LISVHTSKEHFDDLDPIPSEGLDTILKVFRSTAAKQEKQEFLGTRDQSQKDKPYVW